MQSSSPSLTVRHNSAEHRYEIETEGHLAVADYVQDGRRRLMTHTFVPPELRGKGIAEKLVRAAFEDARREGNQIVPQCSYVATFMQRHPEYRDLLASS